MDRQRVIRPASWTIPIVVLFVAAATTFSRGVRDEQDILAGSFYPSMSAAVSVILGVIVTAVAMIAIWLIARRPGRTGLVMRWSLATAVGGLWLGYLAGAGVTQARGGPVEYPGMVRYEFGAPIGAHVEVPAACWSVAGHPNLLAEVKPRVGGLPAVVARSKSQGTRNLQAYLAYDGRQNDDYVLPRVPDRPPDAMLPGFTFLSAYSYVPTSQTDVGFTDRVELAGRWRFEDRRLANDPWPESFEVTVSWTCAERP